MIQSLENIQARSSLIDTRPGLGGCTTPGHIPFRPLCFPTVSKVLGPSPLAAPECRSTPQLCLWTHWRRRPAGIGANSDTVTGYGCLLTRWGQASRGARGNHSQLSKGFLRRGAGLCLRLSAISCGKHLIGRCAGRPDWPSIRSSFSTSTTPTLPSHQNGPTSRC